MMRLGILAGNVSLEQFWELLNLLVFLEEIYNNIVYYFIGFNCIIGEKRFLNMDSFQELCLVVSF